MEAKPSATRASAAIASAPAGDDTDRAAFQAWFTYLADAQFERKTDDVTDCASLVRHAYREALRAHTPAWHRASRLPLDIALPDVRQPPAAQSGGWLLFRVAGHPDRFGEFADADTLIRFNTRRVSRDAQAARPGDLLYFRQDAAESPAHLMVFVGDSHFERSRHDWVVYHTGPSDNDPGEVRKVSLADLAHHPSPRWRPEPANHAFMGVFRLSRLDREDRGRGW